MYDCRACDRRFGSLQGFDHHMTIRNPQADAPEVSHHAPRGPKSHPGYHLDARGIWKANDGREAPHFRPVEAQTVSGGGA